MLWWHVRCCTGSMVRVVVVAAVLALAPPAARGDGLYVSEAFGAGAASGDLASTVGTTLHVRVGLGVRIGVLAIEPWVLSELQTDRDGAWLRLVGGDPAPGTADLSVYGVDAKLVVPVERRVAAYFRTGPSVVEGLGALDGYAGRGIGFGGGVQLTGKIRALGFLWAPLLFVKRGPMATGALFIDAGWDFYRLDRAGAATLHGRLAHVCVGFAIGQSF